MTYLAILAMMLIAFALVGWPLVGPSQGARRTAGGAPWDDLIGERDAAYGAIRDLDFEYEIGNLSDSDYQGLRDRYRSEAAATLQKLDSVVEEAGAATASPTRAASEGYPSAKPGASLSCPSCGGTTETSDCYCCNCGAQLGQRCPNCAGVTQEQDRFCAACGCSLESAA